MGEPKEVFTGSADAEDIFDVQYWEDVVHPHVLRDNVDEATSAPCQRLETFDEFNRFGDNGRH